MANLKAQAKSRAKSSSSPSKSKGSQIKAWGDEVEEKDRDDQERAFSSMATERIESEHRPLPKFAYLKSYATIPSLRRGAEPGSEG